MSAVTAPMQQIIKAEGDSPGIYASVNLNGFTLVSHELPPENKSVILGYRVPHLPEVWFGIGYRRAEKFNDVYWLGATGLAPNYHRLNADQVVIWRAFDKPFCFDEGRPDTSQYLQYRYILGESKWATEEKSKQQRAQVRGIEL